MTCLTRRYAFSASHRLHSGLLSAEQNADVFGKCNNPYGHGHNYYLEVTAAGEIHRQTGMVLAPAALDAYVEKQVLSRLDHGDLNAGVPEMAAVVPTTENLALQIGRWLLERWRELASTSRLYRVRLQETGSNTIQIDFHET